MGSRELFEDYEPGSDKLNLSRRNITSNDVYNLVIPFLIDNPQIKIVNLSHNLIGDDGAVDLANSVSLERLDLSHNYICEMGAQALSASGKITNLDLENNNLLPTNVLGIVLSNLSAREMGLASSVSKQFNTAANINLQWKKKFELYFPAYVHEFQDSINWKRKFEEFYNHNYSKYSNDECKIVDAIFENDLAYIRKASFIDLRKVINKLCLHNGMRFNPQYKKLNDYIYKKCFVSPHKYDSALADLLNGAIRLYQPLSVVKKLTEEKQDLKRKYLIAAMYAEREDVIAYFKNHEFTDIQNSSHFEGNILHDFAKHGRLDLYIHFCAVVKANQVNYKEMMPFEYFGMFDLIQLVESGYLANAITDSDMLQRLLTKVVKSNNIENFNRVMAVFADKLNLSNNNVNAALLKAAANSTNQEIIDQLLAMIDPSQFTAEYVSAIYKKAIQSSNILIVEYLIRQFPDSLVYMAVLDHAMNSEMLDLHLQQINPGDRLKITALRAHFVKNPYKGQNVKKIIDKLHESENRDISSGWDKTLFIQALTNDNFGFVEYLESLESRQLRGVSYWIKSGLLYYLTNMHIGKTQALNRLLSSEKIMKTLDSFYHKEIATILLKKGYNKQFHLCMDTLQRCSPRKYKTVLNDIVKDAAKLGIERFNIVLQRNPPITPGLFRYVRNHVTHPEGIILALKKKMLKTYIANNKKPTTPDYEPRSRLFSRARKNRGLSKQEKLRYARIALRHLENNEEQDNQMKVGKTGELGRIMKMVRR